MFSKWRTCFMLIKLKTLLAIIAAAPGFVFAQRGSVKAPMFAFGLNGRHSTR